MPGEPIDVSEMIAAHDAMRREYGSLPLRVKSVTDGDVERAGVIADHIALMSTFTALHHAGEDALLWPIVRERAPDPGVVDAAEADHSGLAEHADRVAVLAESWRVAPTAVHRAALHVELIAFERAMLRHLAREEAEALPLLATTITESEFGALRAHVRDGLTVDQRSIVLGLILDDTGAALAASLLGSMDPQERADFEQAGAPVYRAYRERLLGV